MDETHIQKILRAYQNFEDVDGFANVASIGEILEKNASLNISRYVSNVKPAKTDAPQLKTLVSEWLGNSENLRSELQNLLYELRCA